MTGNRSWLVWTVLPVAPLILAFVALDILHADGFRRIFQAMGTGAFFPADLELRFFNGLIVYVSIGFFHLAACLAVITVMVLRIRRMQRETRARTWLVLGVSILVLGLLNLAARQEGFEGPLNLTYRSICSAIQPSGVAPHILPGGCTEPGLSVFAWMAVLPYVFGLIAAAFASATASTAGDPFAAVDMAAISEEAVQRIARVETAFQATAFVLVTSTLSLMLFYQLPLTVIENADKRDLLTGFAQGMTMFWGMVFTLTLITIFGPAHLLLRHRLRTDAGPAALPDALTGQGARKRLSNILAVLAPLLLGSSASIVELISSSL